MLAVLSRMALIINAVLAFADDAIDAPAHHAADIERILEMVRRPIFDQRSEGLLKFARANRRANQLEKQHGQLPEHLLEGIDRHNSDFAIRARDLLHIARRKPKVRGKGKYRII